MPVGEFTYKDRSYKLGCTVTGSVTGNCGISSVSNITFNYAGGIIGNPSQEELEQAVDTEQFDKLLLSFLKTSTYNPTLVVISGRANGHTSPPVYGLSTMGVMAALEKSKRGMYIPTPYLVNTAHQSPDDSIIKACFWSPECAEKYILLPDAPFRIPEELPKVEKNRWSSLKAFKDAVDKIRKRFVVDAEKQYARFEGRTESNGDGASSGGAADRPAVPAVPGWPEQGANAQPQAGAGPGPVQLPQGQLRNERHIEYVDYQRVFADYGELGPIARAYQEKLIADRLPQAVRPARTRAAPAKEKVWY